MKLCRTKRTNTPSLLAGWVGPQGHQLKLRHLEEMVNSGVALERFWAKVKKGKPNECWEWTASLNTDGYGQFAFRPENWGKKVNFQAHQLAFYIEHRNLPEGMCVCHKCDNTQCTNFHHLFLGTQADNVKDRDTKGRHWVPLGEASGTAKLDESQVQEIRILWFVGRIRAEEIAAMFGVSLGCIKGIVYGANWKHLPLPIEVF